jgi:nucleoside-diphosphate-sugar epimerase
MRTVLVTGGAGFMGSHLVDQLLDGGAAVRVFDNLSTGSLGNLRQAAERQSRRDGTANGGRLEVVIGDIRDRALLRKALRDVKYIFHLAALPAGATSVVESGDIHAVNVEGTLNLLHGALTEGVWRVVVGSCASVYGSSTTLPVPEDAPLRPSSLFAASKVSAETYCRAFGARHQLDTVMLRYFSVYGSRQRTVRGGALVPRLIEAVRHGHPPGDVEDRTAEDFVAVEDAVNATLAAARAPRVGGRVINIGSGELVSVADVVSILGGLLGTPMAAAVTPKAEGTPRGTCADTTLAAELLDFAPKVSLVAGLARLVRSLVEADEPQPAALAPVGLDDRAGR